MNACVTAGEVGAARQVMHDMQQAGFLASTRCYNILVKGHALDEDVSAVLSTMEEMRAAGFAPNSVTYNTALNALVQDGQLAKVDRLV